MRGRVAIIAVALVVASCATSTTTSADDLPVQAATSEPAPTEPPAEPTSVNPTPEPAPTEPAVGPEAGPPTPEPAPTEPAVGPEAGPPTDRLVGLPLFDEGVGEVGIAFDIVNADLADSFGWPRIDITEVSMQRPSGPGGSGAFAGEIAGVGILGGHTQADGSSVDVVLLLVDPASPRWESAILTTIAMTTDATEGTLAAYDRAVEAISAGPVGTSSYYTQNGRGALFERIESPGSGSGEWFSLTVTGATDQESAVREAAEARAAALGRF